MTLDTVTTENAPTGEMDPLQRGNDERPVVARPFGER
jgi:hypothetical protein